MCVKSVAAYSNNITAASKQFCRRDLHPGWIAAEYYQSKNRHFEEEILLLLTYVNMSELSCENYTEKKASGWNVVYICITIRLQPEHNLAAFVLHPV